MATARRRETLIALRARRTAHRVATDLFLYEHSKPLTVDCARCKRPFYPLQGETICPNCVELVPTELLAYPRARWVEYTEYLGGSWRQILAQARWGELAMLVFFLCCFAATIWALCAALSP